MAFSTFAFRDTTTTSPSTPVDTDNRDFQNIRTTEFVNLDTFEPSGTIPGVRLQCHPEAQRNTRIGIGGFGGLSKHNPIITFCEDSCVRNSSPESQGPTTSVECANYIDQYIRECVEAMGCVSNIQFCGVGGYAKRYKNTEEENTSPSRHSSGDSLDLFGIKCTRRATNGRGFENFAMDFAQHGRKKNTQEYDSFLSCWREKMKSSRPRARGHKGALSCEGSEEPNNSLHNNHLHLSCPTPRKRTGGT